MLEQYCSVKNTLIAVVLGKRGMIEHGLYVIVSIYLCG